MRVNTIFLEVMQVTDKCEHAAGAAGRVAARRGRGVSMSEVRASGARSFCRWSLFLVALLLSVFASGAQQQPASVSPTAAAADFEHFWQDIRQHYCYFSKKRTDWVAVRRLYLPRTQKIATRVDLLHLIEEAIAELYDDHATMGADAAGSPRIVPSRTDLWASWHGDEAG